MHTFVLHRASGSLAVMDSEHSHNVLAELIRQADPAAELSTRLVTHLACVLEPVLSKSTAVYGRETAIQELVPFPQHCHVCKARLAECRSSAAAAVIVDLPGIIQKKHVPLRCRKASCSPSGVLLWHNYRVHQGQHVFHGELRSLRCFMLSSTVGFSISWLQHFHVRLVRQRASFTSEADVLYAQAVTNAQLPLLPAARLRLLISQGWYAWRLLTRALQANLDVSAFDFQQLFAEMVRPLLGPLKDAFLRHAVEGAREANMRSDVVVLDGNAKNRRAVCAAALAGSSYSPQLCRTLRHTCTRTPAFRHCFCSLHFEKNANDDLRDMPWLHLCKLRLPQRGHVLVKVSF